MKSLLARLCLASILPAFLIVLFTPYARTQNPADQDKVVISKDEVSLDVVVRDKKGKMIRDLTLADFEVYEDGVKQELSAFRFVSSTAAEQVQTSTTPTYNAGSSTTTPINPPKPGERTEAAGVSAVALVFDRLSPESRIRARDAALSYLGGSIKTNEMVGVFLTDLSVIVLQPLTYDTEQIKAGIEKVGVQGTSGFTSNKPQTRTARQDVATSRLRTQAGRPRPAEGAESLVAIAEAQLGRLEFYEEMQRDQQGHATSHGLLNIAASLRELPGRKAVIFFSEGLVLPPNVQEVFRSVINEANRSNVSFYAIDVAGLRTESKTAEARQEINSRSELRMAQLNSATDPSGPMTKGLERNEDILRLNPETGLQQLANETGGFLITDSNDLSGRLQKVDEDLHSYYLLNYSSSNKKYDGRFRKIEVKLKRSGLAVQSRKGYYAIPASYGSPVLPYEVAPLAALSNTPKADSFPFFTGAFSFPERERTGLVPVMADVPISAFTVRVDQAKKVYDTDFSIVTLVKDPTGQVVTKLSSQYRLNGPIDKAEDAKKGRVLFYREAMLAPDRYTLETIAYDAPTGRSSVRIATLEVPIEDDSKLRLSDVALLKRAEQVSGPEDNQPNPFRVANMIVSPNLGEPISRSLKQVPFFFTVYHPTGSTTKPKLTIELLGQGQVLAKLPGELPDADALGRSKFVAALPVQQIPAGAYELKISVSAESTTLTRSRKFVLAD